METEQEFRKVSREVFDGLVHNAMFSADSAAIALGPGHTPAEEMRAGVRGALAFLIGYGLVEVVTPSDEPRWYRIVVTPEDVVEG